MKHPPFANILRIAFGALTLLAALAGLVWTFQSLRAEYAFRKIIFNLREEKVTRQTLEGYAGQLAVLTRRDPANSEIRNLYATILGRLGPLGATAQDRQAIFATAVDQVGIARLTLNTRNSLFFLSDMYEKMGDIPHAEATMADCLRINPTNNEFNPAWLHLLGVRLFQMNMQKVKGQLKDTAVYDNYRKTYAQAANNWAIRASNDKNSYLFLANFYIDPLYATQAYKLFLVGLSDAPWLSLNRRAMLDSGGIQDTIRKIINGRYSKPYRSLP